MLQNMMEAVSTGLEYDEVEFDYSYDYAMTYNMLKSLLKSEDRPSCCICRNLYICSEQDAVGYKSFVSMPTVL